MSSSIDTDSDAFSRIRLWATSVLEPFLRIDINQYDRLFTLVFTAFVATLIGLTLQYPPQARLVPLIVGVPTLVLLLGLLAMQFSSQVASVTERWSTSDVLGMEERVREMQTRTDKNSGAATEPAGEFAGRIAVLTISFWVLLLFGLVLTVGFTVGILAFLVMYYRLQAEQSWSRTVGYTLLIWMFIVIIFIYVLKSPLYPGILGIHLPFLR